MKKAAVFFPGIGYTVEKPLMYYSRRLASREGYEIRLLPYSGFPDNVKDNRTKMEEAFQTALSQSRSMMADLDLGSYEEILFIGKSIGTIVAAAIASQNIAEGRVGKHKIRLILYTPLEDTFSFPVEDAVVFTGLADPWTGKEAARIPGLCRERNIPCYTYPDANHSLETGNMGTDLDNLKQIMEKTEEFMKKHGRTGDRAEAHS